MLRRRRPIVLASAAAVAVFALLAAGCGGGASPGVASIPASTTAGPVTTSTTQGGVSAGAKQSGGPGGGHFQVAIRVANAAVGARFSACMRKHGVTNFPDPNGQGVITFGSGAGIDPNSPTFASARAACQKLLPNGGRPTPAEQAQMQQQMLTFSNCMRAHGLKDFPDPSNGGLRIHVHPGSDLDPNNPQFQAAQRACRGKLPGKFPVPAAPGGK